MDFTQVFGYMVSAGWTLLNVCLYVVGAAALWLLFRRWCWAEKRCDWVFEQERRLLEEMTNEEKAAYLLKTPRGFWFGLVKALRGDN